MTVWPKNLQKNVLFGYICFGMGLHFWVLNHPKHEKTGLQFWFQLRGTNLGRWLCQTQLFNIAAAGGMGTVNHNWARLPVRKRTPCFRKPPCSMCQVRHSGSRDELISCGTSCFIDLHSKAFGSKYLWEMSNPLQDTWFSQDPRSDYPLISIAQDICPTDSPGVRHASQRYGASVSWSGTRQCWEVSELPRDGSFSKGNTHDHLFAVSWVSQISPDFPANSRLPYWTRSVTKVGNLRAEIKGRNVVHFRPQTEYCFGTQILLVAYLIHVFQIKACKSQIAKLVCTRLVRLLDISMIGWVFYKPTCLKIMT